MSSLTDSSAAPIYHKTVPAVRMWNVGVRYRTPQERIPSFKEYAIRRIRGQIRYKDFWALRDVSLEVKPGEVFGIIGPNGAGKSTLLKVVARVLKPTEGRVRVLGRVFPLLELGAGFDPELTGRENVYLNGAILGYSKRDLDARFDRIVDFAGLEEFIDAPLRTYSTGMVVRLGFSVATDVRPEILIVDEILGVGDVEFQRKSFERIQSFQAQGTTILLVSHNLEKVKEMCSLSIWLDHGRILSSGPPDSVVAQYIERTTDEEAEGISRKMEVEAPNRWGNRRIEITQVRITNENGDQRAIFETGDTLKLHIVYDAHEPTTSPVFGMAIHRQDGIRITGPNTALAGHDLQTLEGPGKITYTIPYLPLLEGLYHITVAAVDQNDTEFFDCHSRAYPFRVANRDKEVQEKNGLVTLQGKWKHQSYDD